MIDLEKLYVTTRLPYSLFFIRQSFMDIIKDDVDDATFVVIPDYNMPKDVYAYEITDPSLKKQLLYTEAKKLNTKSGCSRPGESCNEYMCGFSKDGVCTNG